MSKVTVPHTSVVDKSAVIGKGTRVWNFVHIRENAEIGKKCVLADYVYVGRGVKVGNNVKLENRATVYEGVTIEDKVFVGPHVTFTNDFIPRSFNTDWKILPTLVQEGASIGAGTVIVCGTTIGEYALIGAGSVVTDDIPSNALAYGNPARVRGFVCRCGRKIETQEKNEKTVLMVCPCCKERYMIPVEDYAGMKKEA
ncbi:N-acetyltransferase [Candidatus Bathyarchaeota archaeon]|nr:N-acetyltransferase [Candidatus Bathyarchaeota archaeon]